MYVIDDPDPTGTRTSDQQQSCGNACAEASRIFRSVQVEFTRATEFDTRTDDQPLTALERLELASLCATLADAFARAADIWDGYRPNLAIAVAYRQQALDLHDADALNTVLAEIAPAAADADPLAG